MIMTTQLNHKPIKYLYIQQRNLFIFLYTYISVAYFLPDTKSWITHCKQKYQYIERSAGTKSKVTLPTLHNNVLCMNNFQDEPVHANSFMKWKKWKVICWFLRDVRTYWSSYLDINSVSYNLGSRIIDESFCILVRIQNMGAYLVLT